MATKPKNDNWIQRSGMRLPRMLWLVTFLLIGGFGFVFWSILQKEMETSQFQADYATTLNQQIWFKMHDEANTNLVFPTYGPYNLRLGYAYIPYFVKALANGNYSVSAQSQTSTRFNSLVSEGVYPIYHAKTTAGLSITDRNGDKIYTSTYPSRSFAQFDQIPKVLVDTLLFIENRELLANGPPTRNPVIEWDRFAYAAFGRLVQYVHPGFNAGGGSTLATQIEKFRFSPNGQTNNSKDKLLQIASASLRVYLDGKDTHEARKKIVLDYLNSTPLSARPGFGEVNGIGDGFWAWFGMDLPDIITALNLPEDTSSHLQTKARAYRAALAMILAQRRPTYYLLTDRPSLDDLTDSMLDKLQNANVISIPLRNATRQANLRFVPDPPPLPQIPFLEQKAVNALRAHLLSNLGLRNLYELDRIDLSARSTLDNQAQAQLTEFLSHMSEPEFLHKIGMYGFRLLDPANDPSHIKWSVVLYESQADGNRLRLQADNIDGPFDMNEGAKLDLGSTAKLRTLITYLEIMAELYRRYAGLAADDLHDLSEEAPDTLTSFATNWLQSHPNASLTEMLNAAMERKYSANPSETFFTGGGAHNFVNFEKKEDYLTMDLHEALRDSVNLVFIRLMRDIVNYTISQGRQTKQEILDDPMQPIRKKYLERYADQEGSVFLNRYITEYTGLTPDGRLLKAAKKAHKGSTARTILFRSVSPQADFATYRDFMKAAMASPVTEQKLQKLYADYPIERYSLADRAYISGLNPMELWLLNYLNANPKASRSTMLALSRPMRIESYGWLFHPRLKGAQDTRIRIMLEEDAFARIQQRWARLGYPFERLVPSLATAIGSSADKPGALAEMVGILVNDGVRKPMLRFDELHFARNTPFETILTPGRNPGQQVLAPEVAKVIRTAMTEVITDGTARRLNGAYFDSQGKPLVIGAKTGTGDHRFDEFGKGGKLIASHVVNRTGTIVFYIGDHFFGTVTAHVAGEDAANYKFTSALSAQMVKSLQPILQPMINGDQRAEKPKAGEIIPTENLVNSTQNNVNGAVTTNDAKAANTITNANTSTNTNADAASKTTATVADQTAQKNQSTNGATPETAHIIAKHKTKAAKTTPRASPANQAVIQSNITKAIPANNGTTQPVPAQLNATAAAYGQKNIYAPTTKNTNARTSYAPNQKYPSRYNTGSPYPAPSGYVRQAPTSNQARQPASLPLLPRLPPYPVHEVQQMQNLSLLPKASPLNSQRVTDIPSQPLP